MILGSSFAAVSTKLVPTTDFSFLIANACFRPSQKRAARDLFSFHVFKPSKAALFSDNFLLDGEIADAIDPFLVLFLDTHDPSQ